MKNENRETSPLFQARMGGFCWLMTFIISAFSNLWLLVKGVNVERWWEQARASRQELI